MEDLYWFFKRKFVEINSDNSGVAVIEIILILVVLVGLIWLCKDTYFLSIGEKNVSL